MHPRPVFHPRLTALLGLIALALLLPALAVAQERGYAGLEVRNLETKESDSLGWEAPRGVFVVSILDDSPAVSADVLVGDIIVSVDGTEMDNIDEFVATVASNAPGTSVRLRVLRTGKERRVTLVLAARPASQPMPETCAKYVPTLGRSIEVTCPESD